MPVTISLVGLTELREALRHLPQELTEEAATIVEAHANQADREIVAAYPMGPPGRARKGVAITPGGLKRGVHVTHNAGHRFGTTSIVKSAAKHASLFEKGTVRRTNNRGANRGAMPPAPPNEAMIPIAIRARRRMVRALIDLVRRAGFEVHE